MRRPRILILSFSPLATDPRVSRQIDLLAPDYEIIAAGFSAPLNPNVSYVALSSRRQSTTHRLGSALRLLARRYDSYYWRIDSVQEALSSLEHLPFDLILANDPDTWPLAQVLVQKTGARLLFDAHEFAPRELEDRPGWRIFYQGYKTTLCRKQLPRANSVTTVCDGIADEYARVFQVPRPLVVRNLTKHFSHEPDPTLDGRVRLIHHGAATPSRNIETMIDLMEFLDPRFTLDLMLVGGDSSYMRTLQKRAASRPTIKFIPPVAPNQIVTTTRHYDIGLFLLPPVNFNYRHALPNKFFEFIQARLAIAIGPSPEMASLVRKHELGVVAADFSPRTLAASLNRLTAANIDAFKAASHRAASLLSWEQEREILRSEVARLINVAAPNAP